MKRSFGRDVIILCIVIPVAVLFAAFFLFKDKLVSSDVTQWEIENALCVKNVHRFRKGYSFETDFSVIVEPPDNSTGNYNFRVIFNKPDPGSGYKITGLAVKIIPHDGAAVESISGNCGGLGAAFTAHGEPFTAEADSDCFNIDMSVSGFRDGGIDLYVSYDIRGRGLRSPVYYGYCGTTLTLVIPEYCKDTGMQ